MALQEGLGFSVKNNFHYSIICHPFGGVLVSERGERRKYGFLFKVGIPFILLEPYIVLKQKDQKL